MTQQNELIPLLPGDILRHKREQEGLTLAQAAERSRIKAEVLDAIESGESGGIPSVYLRGYIRNYARFLGADLQAVEARMERVRGAEPEIQSVFQVDRRRGFAEKWLKVTSYLAASALIGTLAWQFTHEAVRFSQGESELSAATNLPQTATEPAPKADATPLARAGKTHLNASIASLDVLRQRNQQEVGPPAKEAWAAISNRAEDESVASEHTRSLTLRTSADTWIEIKEANGEQLEMDLLRGGSLREYKGQAPFEIMIGRASAVELTMDGESVQLGPHTRGNVARLTLGSGMVEAGLESAAENANH